MKQVLMLLLCVLCTTQGAYGTQREDIERYLLDFNSSITQIGPVGQMTLSRSSWQPYTAVKMITPEAMMAMQYWGIQMDMPKPMDLWTQIYLIGDFSSRNDFINLTPSTKRDGIELDHYADGFRYKQSRAVSVGIGYSRNVDTPLGTAMGIPMGMDQQMLDMMQEMMMDMMSNRQPQQPDNPQGLMKWIMDLRLQGMIGISPIVGSTITADRFVQTKEDVAKLPPLQVPQSKADLEMIANGDLIEYQTRGGIIFNAALAVALPQAPMISLGVGADYFAQGDWTISLLKLDDSKVLATLKKSSLQSFKLLTFMGAHQLLTLDLEKERFKQVTKGLSFVFDLNDPEVEKLYKEFLVGNIKLIQSRVYNGTVSGIVSTEQTRLKAKIKRRSIKLTHFIRSSRMSGYLNTFSVRNILSSNTTQTIHASLYQKGKESRFFSRIKKMQNNFLSIVEEKNGKREDVSGEFIFNFETNKGKGRLLRKAIAAMSKVTGLHKELMLKVPSTRKLGFMASELRIKINKNMTEFLSAMADLPMGMKTVRDLSNKFIQSNEDENDPLNICSINQSDDESMRDLCLRSFRRKTRKGIERSLDLLHMMGINLQNRNYKIFNSHYAEFGELMLNNSIIFQTYFQLLKEKGLTLKYKIIGSRLSYLEKEISWKE